MTKMMTGWHCGEDNSEESVKAFKSRIESAKAKIDRFAFVGLTERWSQSMCMFARVFPRASGRPYPDDIAGKFRPSVSPGCKELSDEIMTKRGFVDMADSQIYAHGV